MSRCFRIHANRPIQEELYEPTPARHSTLGSPVPAPQNHRRVVSVAAKGIYQSILPFEGLLFSRKPKSRAGILKSGGGRKALPP